MAWPSLFYQDYETRQPVGVSLRLRREPEANSFRLMQPSVHQRRLVWNKTPGCRSHTLKLKLHFNYDERGCRQQRPFFFVDRIIV